MIASIQDLPQIPNFHCSILRPWVHPVSITLKSHSHNICRMRVIAHYLLMQHNTASITPKKKNPYFNNKKLIIKKGKTFITWWGLFELTSNSLMCGFPAAAKYLLSGVISSLLTCFIHRINKQNNLLANLLATKKKRYKIYSKPTNILW
jgi:hypothetical protein